MADITVRPVRFTFDRPIDFDVPDPELRMMLGSLALSLTMPHLEPYLIRTMKTAGRQITDPVLAEDARRFSQQEGHHFRNHADFNERIRGSFDGDTAAGLLAIEADLEADYQRFTREKSLRFNLAYAEGFEAMTCAFALASAEYGTFEGTSLPGGEIWAWHMAEEIEHRTVAFGVFEHLVGSYPVRVVLGAWAQWHYLSCIGRLAGRMAEALGRRPRARTSDMQRAALRGWLRTFSPWYHPAKIRVPARVDALLARYSAQAGSAGA